MRTAEVHDTLEAQLVQLTAQLGHLANDRRRMERELDEVQLNLRANNELADEVKTQITHFQHGIRDSMDKHMVPSSQVDDATGTPPSRDRELEAESLESGSAAVDTGSAAV